MRFDSKRMPELYDKAVAAGVPKDQAKKLGAKDSEILATALFYQADRLTTYDPFLLFLGREYIEKETGLIIDRPTSPFLPFPEEKKNSQTLRMIAPAALLASRMRSAELLMRQRKGQPAISASISLVSRLISGRRASQEKGTASAQVSANHAYLGFADDLTFQNPK